MPKRLGWALLLILLWMFSPVLLVLLGEQVACRIQHRPCESHPIWWGN